MASNYPTSIDSFTDPLSNSPLNNPSHAGQHQDLNDAVEKLETKLGVTASPAASASAGHVLTATGSGSTWQEPAVTAAQFATVGLVYITSTTVGSAVSSVTISNCFSSTYDNYRILVNGGTASANNNLIMTLNGAATGYYGALIYGLSTGTAPLLAAANNAASWPFMGYHTTGSGIITSIEVLGPNLAKQTVIQSVYYNTGGNGTFTGTLDNTTQHTGFTLTPTTGTLTGGTITVYGYRKA